MRIFTKGNRVIGILIAVTLFALFAFIMILNRQEPAAEVLASETSIPTNSQTDTVTSLRNPKFLKDTSLIHIDEACDAPCWRDIVPGKTKFEDALIILQGDTDFDNLRTQPVQDSDTAILATWQTTSGESCCQLIADDGETVSAIFFQLAPDMTVKQLIDARGEPEYVLGNRGKDDQAIINLFYPEQSMTVFAFVAGAATGTLSETSEIIGVYYTTPQSMDMSLKLSSFYGWKGYQPFSAYAPEIIVPLGNATPDFKLTPSVTLTPNK